MPSSLQPEEALLARLPEDVAEVARQWERIELVGTVSEFFPPDGLDFRQIVPSELKDGGIRIGAMGAGTDVFSEIVVIPGQAGVYVVLSEGDYHEYYPSIFHWLLVEYHFAKRENERVIG